MNNQRIHLTLKYTAILSVVLTVALLIIYFVSARSRYEAFQGTLRSEAITKANLFLENRVDAETMQHIYLNNTQFINEIEVAVYTPDFRMLYHDAAEHDIVKETAEMIREIYEQGELPLPAPQGYQAVGICYNGQYIVTAAAHDGYGESNLMALRRTLIIIFLVSLLLMLLVGYYLATITIRPIERALASQKMFVSNVSHELRTPLAAIMGELGLALQKERTPADYQLRIGRALDDANRMSDIIIGLLNMARAEYDASQIKMEKLRVDELLMDVRADLLRAKPDYHIELKFANENANENANEDWLTIHANRYLLSLAFRNLIENNCKYSPDHTSRIEIHLPQSDRSIDRKIDRTFDRHKNNALSITFSDHGRGMSTDEQNHLFTLFYRGESSTETGHGIGMALVQRILALHHYHIQVLSKSGHGTTFSLYF